MITELTEFVAQSTTLLITVDSHADNTNSTEIRSSSPEI